MSQSPRDPITIETKEESEQAFPTVVLGLLLIYPYFRGVIPVSLMLGMFGIGAFLFVCWYLGNIRTLRTKIGMGLALWTVLAIYAFVSHIFVLGDAEMIVVVFSASIALMVVATSTTHWHRAAGRVLVAYSSIHAIATIVFYLRPPLFDALIRPRFFHDASADLGYQTALTSNSGFNAMYCVIGLIIISNRLIFERVENSRRWKLALLVLIFIIALLLTAKRAHLVFALVSILLAYSMSSASTKVPKMIAGGAVGMVSIWWLAGISDGVARSLDRLLFTFEATDLSEVTSGRTFLWEYALTGWAQSPLIGNGWASFHVVWLNGRTESYIAHNQLLNTLYEGGIIGATLFVGAAILSVVTAFRCVKLFLGHRDTSIRISAAASSFSIQVFLLMYSLSGGELLSKPYTFVPYFIAIAVGYGIKNSGPPQVGDEGRAHLAVGGGQEVAH